MKKTTYRTLPIETLTVILPLNDLESDQEIFDMLDFTTKTSSATRSTAVVYGKPLQLPKRISQISTESS